MAKKSLTLINLQYRIIISVMRGPGGGLEAPSGAVPDAQIEVACSGEGCSADNSAKTEDEPTEPVNVRSLFPETWLWDIVSVGLVFDLWELTENQKKKFLHI